MADATAPHGASRRSLDAASPPPRSVLRSVSCGTVVVCALHPKVWRRECPEESPYGVLLGLNQSLGACPPLGSID